MPAPVLRAVSLSTSQPPSLALSSLTLPYPTPALQSPVFPRQVHRLAEPRGESSSIPSPRPSLPPFTASFPGGPLWKWSENRVSLWLFIKDVCVSVCKERERMLKNERVPFPISPQLPPPSPTHLWRWTLGLSLSLISDTSAASMPRAPLSPLSLPRRISSAASAFQCP